VRRTATTPKVMAEATPIPFYDMFADSYVPYALWTLLQRALRFSEDGLKPVHRRILYSMYRAHLTPDRPRTKSANVVGDTMKLHPHGDGSIYDAMVRLAQPFSMRVPLVDGRGNFGTLDGKQAAMRYTEARLSKAGVMMLEDCNDDILDFIENSSARMSEPIFLASKFPNILINGDEGIAVSMASTTPCHNPSEVCDAITLFIDKPKSTVEDLLEVMPGPDFPSAGILYDNGGVQSYYTTGLGSMILQGRAIIDSSQNPVITIVELPYQIGPTLIMQEITKALQNETSELLVGGIQEFNDYSDSEYPVRIVIELKSGYNPQAIIEELYRVTSLRTSFNVNQNIVHEGRPMMASTMDVIRFHINHRRRMVTKRIEQQLAKARIRLSRVAAYIAAINHGEAVIKTIRGVKDKTARLAQLKSLLKLDDEQVDYVVAMSVDMFSPERLEAFVKEKQEVIDEIADCEDLLVKPKRIDTIIKREVAEVKKLVGDERRTKIVSGVPEKVSQEDSIEEIPVTVMVNQDGTAKVVARFDGELTEREQQFVKELHHCTTLDKIMAISATGMAIAHPIHTLEIADRRRVGDKLFELDQILTFIVYRDDPNQTITMLTKQGKIKKSTASEYIGTYKKPFPAIKLLEGDEVVSVIFSENEDNEYLIVTDLGFAVRYPTNLVSPIGRYSQGVVAVSDKSGQPVGLLVCEPDSKQQLCVVTGGGLAKRLNLTEIPCQKGRAGKGVSVFKSALTKVVSSILVRPSSTLQINISDGSSETKTASSVALCGRVSRGKMIVSLVRGQRISNVKII